MSFSERARLPLTWLRNGAMIIAVIGLVALVVVQIVDVAMRNLSVKGGATGAAEWSSLLLATVVLASLPELVYRDVHIRVDFLYGWLPKRAKFAADVLSDVACTVLFGIVGWFAVPWAIKSVEIQERAMGLAVVPIYPVKVAFAAIAILLTLMSLAQLVRLLVRRGRPADTADEEDEADAGL